MTHSADDFSWMDRDPIELPKVKKPKRRVKKAKRKVAKKAVKVEAQSKVTHAAHRGKVMFKAVNGRKRIWACDGEYVYFRRKSCIDPAKPGEVHQAIVRHQKFLDRGDYTYVETQDDVEICKVNESSPFFRKGVYLGQLSEGGLNRAVVIAACKRDWPLYADTLEELAGRIKGKWQTSAQQTLCWGEHLAYIDHLVKLRGGPTPEERGAALTHVRTARGEGKGRVILLSN